MIPSVALATLVSLVACLALAPLIRNFCLHFKIVDHPGPLKIHSRPVPRLGGIAITLAVVAGILISNREDAHAETFFLLAVAVVFFVGLADDLRSVSPYLRLAAQITAGIVMWLGGWRFTSAEGLMRSGPLSLLLVCAVAVIFANSWNLLDGSDGIAAGNAAIVAASYLAISRGAGEPLAFLVAACIVASCAGFLPYNWPHASIYLGDSGSTVLGSCIGFLTLCPATSFRSSALLHLSPFVVAGLPLVDTALVLVRRIKRGQSILQGDRRHLYDEMLALGWSARRVALATYATTMGLAIIAWFGAQSSFREFLLAWSLSLAGLLVIASRLGCLRAEPPVIRSHAGISVAVGKSASKTS